MVVDGAQSVPHMPVDVKELDIDFKGFGIRLSAVKPVKSDYVFIQYTGEIGKADFRCWYV